MVRVCLQNRSMLGVTFLSLPLQTVIPNIIPLSVSVLAVVASKVETTMIMLAPQCFRGCPEWLPCRGGIAVASRAPCQSQASRANVIIRSISIISITSSIIVIIISSSNIKYC